MEHRQPAHKFLSGLRQGALHKALNIPEDQDIPESRLSSAMNSSDEHVRKMAHLANSMKHWNK